MIAQRKVAVLVLVICLLCHTPRGQFRNDGSVPDYSLVKPFKDFKWDLVGSTLVTNDYVRLTSNAQSQKGGIWSKIPNRSINWEVHVHFKVHGSERQMYGDGLAIWYTKDRLQLGPVFGSKDYFEGLGIFLDTYSNNHVPHNHAHPYISAMVNNGSSHYDHDRDGTHTQLAGCECKFRNSFYETHVAIRYESNTLTVSTDVVGKQAWRKCIYVNGVNLPEGLYFGASATTGDLADNHDIISIRIYDLGLQPDDVTRGLSGGVRLSASVFDPPRDAANIRPEGDVDSNGIAVWKIIMGVFLFIIAACVCAVGGVVIYNSSAAAQARRKRLY